MRNCNNIDSFIESDSTSELHATDFNLLIQYKVSYETIEWRH